MKWNFFYEVLAMSQSPELPLETLLQGFLTQCDTVTNELKNLQSSLKNSENNNRSLQQELDKCEKLRLKDSENIKSLRQELDKCEKLRLKDSENIKSLRQELDKCEKLRLKDSENIKPLRQELARVTNERDILMRIFNDTSKYIVRAREQVANFNNTENHFQFLNENLKREPRSSESTLRDTISTTEIHAHEIALNDGNESMEYSNQDHGSSSNRQCANNYDVFLEPRVWENDENRVKRNEAFNASLKNPQNVQKDAPACIANADNVQEANSSVPNNELMDCDAGAQECEKDLGHEKSMVSKHIRENNNVTSEIRRRNDERDGSTSKKSNSVAKTPIVIDLPRERLSKNTSLIADGTNFTMNQEAPSKVGKIQVVNIKNILSNDSTSNTNSFPENNINIEDAIRNVANNHQKTSFGHSTFTATNSDGHCDANVNGISSTKNGSILETNPRGSYGTNNYPTPIPVAHSTLFIHRGNPNIYQNDTNLTSIPVAHSTAVISNRSLSNLSNIHQNNNGLVRYSVPHPVMSNTSPTRNQATSSNQLECASQSKANKGANTKNKRKCKDDAKRLASKKVSSDLSQEQVHHEVKILDNFKKIPSYGRSYRIPPDCDKDENLLMSPKKRM